MVQRGWAAHVLGHAEHTFTECVSARHAAHTCDAGLTRAACSPVEAVKALRKITPNDQYLPSFVIGDGEGKARAEWPMRACVACALLTAQPCAAGGHD